LKGYGISQGFTLNTDVNFTSGLKIVFGATLMDVFTKEKEGLKMWQVQTPRFTSNWSASYAFYKSNITLDLTGTTTSPMRLPILLHDFREEFSPWFSIVNIQIKKELNQKYEIYGGVKNVFNFMPQNPLMRPFDPFDKRVQDNNPYHYTFDTSYNYAPLQGIRGYLGIRMTIK
jgi:outer membrane receptor for ferrienterochelin and colicins